MHRTHTHFARFGFTLTELLVVIGIIVLLLSILVPMTIRAYSAAEATKVRHQIQMIVTALEAYKADFNDYPRPTSTTFNGTVANPYGAQILCNALIAPLPAATDGAEGPGFRLRGTQGKVYGPYLPPDQFKYGQAAGTAALHDGTDVLLDPFNKPILYYVAPTPPPSVNGANGFVAANAGALYNSDQNNNTLLSKATLQTIQGDTNNSGIIDVTETPTYTGPYLLWTTGNDGEFGLDANGKSDDICNFDLSPGVRR